MARRVVLVRLAARHAVTRTGLCMVAVLGASAAAPWLPSPLGVALVLTSCVMMVALDTSGAEMAPIRGIWWRLGERIAYRSAGSPDWWTAGFFRSMGFTPDDVRMLSSSGWTASDLAWIASEGWAIGCTRDRLMPLLSATGPHAAGGLMTVLGRRLGRSVEDQGVFDELLLAGVDPFDAARWANVGAPAWYVRGRSERRPAPLEIEFGSQGQEQGLSWQDLANWREVAPDTAESTDPVSAVEVMVRWRDVAGPDAPWWAAAGYDPSQARQLLADGARPSRDELAAQAALRIA